MKKPDFGQFQQLLKTQVILILNFTINYCDYWLMSPKLLNFWMYKTATVFGRECRSHILLNLPGSFFHSPTIRNVPLVLCPFLHVFVFALAFYFFGIFLVNCFETTRHFYKKTTSRWHNLLLGNLRTNRVRVILPSSQTKLRKDTVFILPSMLSVLQLINERKKGIYWNRAFN